MRTPNCSSPRPATSKLSLLSLSVILIATLPSDSLSKRSRIMREVTLSPSRPASGLSFTVNAMESVGGSIGCAFNGISTSGAQIVSATVPIERPAIAIMSPAIASSIGARSSPSKDINFVARPVSTTSPF